MTEELEDDRESTRNCVNNLGTMICLMRASLQISSTLTADAGSGDSTEFIDLAETLQGIHA